MNRWSTVGSLCSGIAGLERAIDFDHLEFLAETAAHPSAVLAERHPTVPNLGDWTECDVFPAVDLLIGGLPCQSISTAGARLGMSDERWLFDDLWRIVGNMERRPDLFLENVGHIRTIDGGDALSSIVRGLAGLGYRWTYGCLPSRAVGAPHGRNRWWLYARHQDGLDRARSAPADSGRGDAERRGRSRRVGRPLPEAREQAGRRDPRGDTPGDRGEDAPDSGRVRRLPRSRSCEGEQAELWRDGLGDHGRATPPDTDGLRREGEPTRDREETGVDLQARSDLDGRGDPDDPELGVIDRDRFADYAAPIARWELILGRPAPPPMIDGKLHAVFVEWMMGYPEGWATDVIPRRPSLKAFGNAPVPQCAETALDLLVDRLDHDETTGEPLRPNKEHT